MMINQEFAEGSTWVHKLDPRLKILMVVMLAIIVAVGESMPMLIQAVLLASFFIVAAKLSWKKVLKRLLVINFFIFGIWIFIPFTYPGTALFYLGPLTASYEGVIYALRITLRSNAIMLAMIALLSTSEMTSLLQAMKQLYIPEKLIYLFFFVYRYIHVIADEFSTLHNSVLNRGFKPRTNLHSYRTYAYLVGMLLIKSYDRSNRVYQAMLARGFKGKLYIRDNFSISVSDLLVFSATVVLISWFIMIEVGLIII
ncbi:cobalt ECF transporter T component CbiQ [Fuchsiella alkaliacetigena]|uniref:cobalt ECF transporter T component CbiQ n=1 Tax=Fuchsiella alkaliacetigena TaxID=957042 RepID=UPI00200A7E03|nr:cobalt ECF transporter T component CbiQ [Fuchsiella alkaliacetigena]